MPQRWKVFDLRLDDVPVQQFKVKSSGLSARLEYPGIVSEYEQREAARFAMIGWHDYSQMSTDERAKIVAHHRLSSRLEAVLSERAEKKAQQAERRARSSKG